MSAVERELIDKMNAAVERGDDLAAAHFSRHLWWLRKQLKEAA
jgi:hypothetical protein